MRVHQLPEPAHESSQGPRICRGRGGARGGRRRGRRRSGSGGFGLDSSPVVEAPPGGEAGQERGPRFLLPVLPTLHLDERDRRARGGGERRERGRGGSGSSSNDNRRDDIEVGGAAERSRKRKRSKKTSSLLIPELRARKARSGQGSRENQSIAVPSAPERCRRHSRGR